MCWRHCGTLKNHQNLSKFVKKWVKNEEIRFFIFRPPFFGEKRKIEKSKNENFIVSVGTIVMSNAMSHINIFKKCKIINDFLKKIS